MYKLGEHPVVAKFPYAQSAFSITFYGAQGKGSAYISLYKDNGSLISSIILENVTNGPYGFSDPNGEIMGFSLYNTDVGGLAIYEIRYRDGNTQLPYFLDNFGTP